MGSQALSLWSDAAAKLSEADQKLLAFDDASNHDSRSLDVIDKLGQTTNEAYETCIRKRWQIKLPGKQDKIIVRDLLGKITHWIEVFKTVGDQAISFDPGHAALPWAGARFLLQVGLMKRDERNDTRLMRWFTLT
ncbi:uncharacterized protein N7482_009300 [Penicillium canariense]|uniref:NWD NACHT-NTPase N-terminal domain-containing protein n=1 Tax=Penicillium canariense TaxID=189055 RepID=A0A9W9HNV6_9EURO|nr:uncharacterized protein N7482_009300 [Penicillium canariense]KAJ5152822.1 hypothetical protein N7482_009300 [Penicillium canariense]